MTFRRSLLGYWIVRYNGTAVHTFTRDFDEAFADVCHHFRIGQKTLSVKFDNEVRTIQVGDYLGRNSQLSS